MRKLILCSLVWLYSLFVPALYAVEHWSLTDPKKFPQQPALFYDSFKLSINPITMTALNIGVSSIHRCLIPTNSRDIFNPSAFLTDAEWGENIGVRVSAEMPFYQLHRAFGMEGNFSSIDTDGLLTYTRKKSMSLGVLGNLAGILTVKGGIVVVRDREFEYKLTPAGIQRLSHIKGYGVGGTGGIALGVDWYFSQWFGVFLQGSLKGNGILQTTHDYSLPRTYYTLGVTIGLKTTF